jgi:hypothetical protein
LIEEIGAQRLILALTRRVRLAKEAAAVDPDLGMALSNFANWMNARCAC